MTQHEENLRSTNPGVRWQAQMEDHLAAVRERQACIADLSVVHHPTAITLHAAVMQANALAALALAVAGTGGDLELAITKLGDGGLA